MNAARSATPIAEMISAWKAVAWGALAAASAVLFAACGGNDDANSCTPACGAREFCCLGACQPQGSVCGGGGAASQGSGGSSGDSGGAGPGGSGGSASGGGGAGADPCTPQDGASAVATACQSDGKIVHCDSGLTEIGCNMGYVCVDWVDPMTQVSNAFCPEVGHTAICDRDSDVGKCNGSVAHGCSGGTGQNYPPTPPGFYQDIDCVAMYGAASRCVDDDKLGPSCTKP
jgi:hypothetical protein